MTDCPIHHHKEYYSIQSPSNDNGYGAVIILFILMLLYWKLEVVGVGLLRTVNIAFKVMVLIQIGI